MHLLIQILNPGVFVWHFVYSFKKDQTYLWLCNMAKISDDDIKNFCALVKTLDCR